VAAHIRTAVIIIPIERRIRMLSATPDLYDAFLIVTGSHTSRNSKKLTVSARLRSGNMIGWQENWLLSSTSNSSLAIAEVSLSSRHSGSTIPLHESPSLYSHRGAKGPDRT